MYKLRVNGLSAWFQNKQVLFDIHLEFPEKKVIAIIGPSGCGKTTFLRCLNRMHELTPGARVEGKVILDGKDIYSEMDAMEVRRKIGMVFQKPNPFPHMSIYDNVVAGLKLMGIRDRKILDGIVERKLKEVGLWDEVCNDLKRSGAQLSGGQQQRLCIARALATEPEVLLMDEPTSSLDPASSARVEALIRVLKNNTTIVIVTHNIQQAARISDFTAFIYNGKLIEYGETKEIFESPKDPLTEKYITGRFG
ncbi:MAG: phosphate ABC transporter ATP-binding protein PstB [Candidatus Methanomethyliaceae archaeon]|nr:phosphate ABC transporter ATP-binding protein PstB [Candidatus Methanomethyliaceae archaeon]MDW7970423.1 phosphate ABC transporter ATP-binding protein PstB [Nitrososphaerota archaeon]